MDLNEIEKKSMKFIMKKIMLLGSLQIVIEMEGILGLGRLRKRFLGEKVLKISRKRSRFWQAFKFLGSFQVLRKLSSF